MKVPVNCELSYKIIEWIAFVSLVLRTITSLP